MSIFAVTFSQPVKWLIQGLFLLGLVLLVNVTIGWQPLLKPWQTIDTTSAFFAVLLLVVSYIVRALRLVNYFQEIPFSRSLDCLRLSVIHNMYNNILPMRAGELSFPILMSKEFSVSYQKSSAALVWLRILDLICILVIAAAALLFIWGYPLLAVLLAVTSLLLPLWISWLFNTFVNRLLAINPGWHKHIEPIRQGWPDSRKMVWNSWLWTVLNWGVKFVSFALVLTWFIELEISHSLIGIIGAELTSVLPIHSFAGIGTYESGMILSLTLLHVPTADIAVAAINLHLFVIGMTLISGIIAILFNSIKSSGSKPENPVDNSYD